MKKFHLKKQDMSSNINANLIETDEAEIKVSYRAQRVRDDESRIV